MTKKLLFIAFMLLLQSCNIVIIYSEKKIYMGNGEASISGSELKDNQANQKADGKLSVPVVP